MVIDMELTEVANWMQELENILNIKAWPINSDDLNKRQGAGWLRSYGINQFYDEQRKLGILSRLREMDDRGFSNNFITLK